MKVLFDVNHAGHVHFVKNAYKKLTEEGFECLITASDKPLVYALLDEYKIPYHPMGSIGKSLFAKLLRLVLHDFKLFLYCLKHRPKVILGIVAIRGSHVGWLLRIRTMVFTDTEHAKMQIALFKPFANEIHNPNWFKKDLGKKQVRYEGFHELAYLHPNNFHPNQDVLAELELKHGDEFFILRFVAWDATHDKNQSGISLDGKKEIIKLLSQHGKVFITSEYELEPELKKYELNIPYTFLHDAMFYAKAIVSEGATTACEAALLGIPTIYINSLSLGYISYLEKEYDLLYHMVDQPAIIAKINSFLANPKLKEEWLQKRKDFLKTQFDTTEYILDIIKNDKS